MRKSALYCLAALVLFAASALAAESPLLSRVKEKTLPNGLQMIVLNRPGAPVVSLHMAFKVGAVDEPSGRTGMAHLLEHMLFKGTRALGTKDWAAEEPVMAEIEKTAKKLDRLAREGKAGTPEGQALAKTLGDLQNEASRYAVKGEIDALYSQNGGVGLNASTSADMTDYFVSLPSNRLELWATIESDRMRDPVLREYYTERSVVGEERRQRSEAKPQGLMYRALLATAFSAHPYRNPVIGWDSDTDLLDVDATRDFYRRFYGPDNAVVVAVGDVQPEAFFSLVERYFGDIPARGGERATPTVEPPQAGGKTVKVTFDAQPDGVLAYHKPTLPDRADYVMDVADGVLSGGAASRLVSDLVYKRKVLTSVSTSNGLPGARYANLFAVFFTPAQGVSIEDAAAAVRVELKKLGDEPPTKDELARVIASLEADLVRGLLSDAGLARRLAYFQVIAGDWRYVERLPTVLSTVTGQEVADAARKYFTADNETLAWVGPGEKK